jgi:iron(III) transport system substrate-binding protein
MRQHSQKQHWSRAEKGPTGVRYAIAGILLLCVAASLAARSPRPAEGSQAGEALNLYSARHYDSDDALFDGFAERTGIRVNIIEGDADQLIERIRAEGRNSPADVLLTVDAGRIWRAQEAGLFRRTSSPVLESRVPSNYRDPQGHWFGFSVRARVIAYSRDRVRVGELSTYEALADPRWRRRVLVRSSSHVYNQSLVGALMAAHGEAATEHWARGLVANFARPPQGGDTDQLKAIAAGLADVAIVNHYYYARLLNSAKPDERDIAQKVALFYPNQGPGERGVHVNISGGGVVASAPHAAAARAFLEYLTSDDAQRLFARGAYEYPVVPNIPRDPTLLGLRAFKADALNPRVYGSNNARALQLMLLAGWR